MGRALLRLRRSLARLARRFRWVPEAVVVTLAALVVGGTIMATAVGADWTDIFRSQALNIVFAAVLAGFAYLLFVLRFRRGELNRYLELSRPRASDLWYTEGSDPLAKTIVEELLEARPPHACLIKGPAGTEHSRLLADVRARLARKRRVPVVVDVAHEAGVPSLPTLTRDRFVAQLVGSSGDAQSGRRVYASLVRQQRVVALVKGLDQVGQGKPLAMRRDILREILEGSLAEKIPFVAWVREDLAPSISEVAAFRARPMLRPELVNFVRSGLSKRGIGREGEDALVAAVSHALDETEPTRDPAVLDLALDLLARRVRAGEEAEAALRTLFSDGCVFRRRLAWMSEWALSCSLEEIGASDSPSALSLAVIGKEAHYQKDPELSLDDATQSLDPDDRRRFAAGVALLSERDVVTVSGLGGGRGIRFTHPMWFSFAGTLGLRLDPPTWRDLLQPGLPAATLDALTGALLVFRPRTVDERSFVRVLTQIGLSEKTDMSLEMVLAVILALQADGEPLDLDAVEIKALHRSWDASSDSAKLRFVADVDFSRDPALMHFLWSHVTYPRFDENSFRVRRAICTRLGLLGNRAWAQLRDDWQGLVESSSREDLSVWRWGNDRWKMHDYALASLGWVLPGLLLTVSDEAVEPAYELLGALRDVVRADTVNSGVSGSRPEIGLEISLAEGFKAAAVEAAAVDGGLDLRACGARWWSEAWNLLDAARSWISQQALVQALALTAPGDSTRVRERVRELEQSPQRHPFVREAARLAARALDQVEERRASASPAEADIASMGIPEGDIWFEEDEALDDGGVNLAPPTHRLLGLSTLLINLAEWRFRAWQTDPKKSEFVEARERAFTGIELPKCFQRSNHAATMFDTECDCSFGLCGPTAKVGVLEERRVFSRSFLQRSQVTAGWEPLGTTRLFRLPRRLWRGLALRNEAPLFAGKAFALVWKSLDMELVSRGESD